MKRKRKRHIENISLYEKETKISFVDRESLNQQQQWPKINKYIYCTGICINETSKACTSILPEFYKWLKHTSNIYIWFGFFFLAKFIWFEIRLEMCVWGFAAHKFHTKFIIIELVESNDSAKISPHDCVEQLS